MWGASWGLLTEAAGWLTCKQGCVKQGAAMFSCMLLGQVGSRPWHGVMQQD